MKKIAIPLMFMICLQLAGCGPRKLSEQEAARIIRGEMKYPQIMDYNVFRADPLVARLALESNLEAEGFLRVQRTQKLVDIGSPLIDFTEKAKPFLLKTSDEELLKEIQKVKLGDEDFAEITGIKTSDNGKAAVVEYTTTLTNLTPFTALLPRKLKQTTTKNKANFALYDDGWRLDKKAGE